MYHLIYLRLDVCTYICIYIHTIKKSLTGVSAMAILNTTLWWFVPSAFCLLKHKDIAEPPFKSRRCFKYDTNRYISVIN